MTAPTSTIPTSAIPKPVTTDRTQRLVAVDEDLDHVDKLLGADAIMNVLGGFVVLVALVLVAIALGDLIPAKVSSADDGPVSTHDVSLPQSSSTRSAIDSSTSPLPSSPTTDSILASASR